MRSPVNARYLVSYAVIVLAGLVMVAGVGYYKGPSHLASHQYEKGIADILLSGSNVRILGSYDEGIAAEYYVSGLSDRKEVIVLGSSRALSVRGHLFPRESFFNSGLSGARLRDLLGAYELYEKRGFAPSVLVLTLDPWILNGSIEQLIWTSLKNEYFSMARRLNTAPMTAPLDTEYASNLRDLLSLPYFRQAVTNLFTNRNEEGYYATENLTADGQGVRLSDGSFSWPVTAAAKSADEVETEAKAWAATDLKSWVLTDFTALDRPAMRSLGAFVEHLQNEGVQVIFYLPPFHPAVYDILAHSEQYSIILQVEEYYRNLANERGIPVVGGYDPQESASTREDFYDAFHPKDSSVDKAFSAAGLYTAQVEPPVT